MYTLTYFTFNSVSVMLILSFLLTVLYYYPLFAAFCSPSSLTWPILPGVSHWIQCVLILQIAVCETHPICSWGSSHITQNGTAPHIQPLFFHCAVLSARLGPCTCGALWWKPIRQIFEECSEGTLDTRLSRVPHFHINISVMLAWRSHWMALFFCFRENSERGTLLHYIEENSIRFHKMLH